MATTSKSASGVMTVMMVVLLVVAVDETRQQQLLASRASRTRVRRVFNGFETLLGEFPFCVLTAVWTGVTNINCSGTLVSDHAVLTAAHCHGDDGVVLAGNVKFASERDLEAAWVQKDYIREFVLYDQDGADSYHDIMLVKLKHGFHLNFFVNKIALAAMDRLSADWEAVGTFVGYGMTSSSSAALSLQRKMVVAVRPVRKVNFSLAAPDVVRRSACHGDSGGPLVVDGQLYGVLSGGAPLSPQVPCGPNQQNVFMFVGYYRAWILASASASTTTSASQTFTTVALLYATLTP